MLPLDATLTASLSDGLGCWSILVSASAACSPAASMRDTGIRAELEKTATVFFGASLVN
jgi:hypothetical protein